MNRKQRRALERKTGSKVAQNFSDKISQFHKLPDQCTTCDKPFDKKDRDMLASWNVVVRQEVVRLFCPHCINKTQQLLEEHGEKDESRENFFQSLESDLKRRD